MNTVIDMSAVSAERRDRPTALVASPDITPTQMLAIAVQQGADLAKLEKLMDLRDRWEATEARKAYVVAMAQFKSEPARIVKTKQVNIPGGAKFAHATLADVCDGIVANLSKYGLSHGWETNQMENGWVEVSCVITHEAGHSERTTLRAPPDDSGKKNSIQQIASTVTYLERYTLMAACGLAAKDIDNDGNGAGQQSKPKPNAPEGYENWRADMDTKAEDGQEPHLAAWKGSKDVYRQYAVTHDKDWWETSKRKASKVQA